MPRPTPLLIPLLSLCSITALREAQAEDQPCPSQEQVAPGPAAPPAQAGCTLHEGQPCPSHEEISTAASPQSRKLSVKENTLPAGGNVEVDAEQVESDIRQGTLTFKGNVTVRQGVREVKGEQLEYNRHANSVKSDSTIDYTDPLVHLTGANGSYSPEQGGDFKGAEFELLQRPARGKAQSMWWTPQGVLRMDGVSFTTCPVSDDAWRINARRVQLDTQSKIGTAKDATIDFGGIPVLWLPSMSFPLSNERKSGFLFPMIGETSQSGALVSAPFYWNIAPNVDFTFEPTWYSRRNEDIGGDLRYLTESSRGELSWNYLPNDVTYGKLYGGGGSSERSRVVFSDVTELPGNFRLSVRGENVSDGRYFEDFSQGPEGTATAFLDRAALLSYRDEHWRVDVEAEQYQTVDTNLPLEQRPYERMPRVAVSGDFGAGPGQLLSYGFDAEGVRFDRSRTRLEDFPDVSTAACTTASLCLDPCANTLVGCQVNGWRFMVTPRAQLNLGGAGWFFRPGVAYSTTQYELSNAADSPELPGITGRYSPSRNLPLASVDTGLVLERSTGGNEARTLTLEPRLMYLYAPYRNQDGLPFFDTYLPDLNPIQLFRTNRYVGGDRIGDANQISAGLTSRLLDETTGQQFLSATIGQAYYFTPPKVTVPGELTCSPLQLQGGQSNPALAAASPAVSTPCLVGSHSDFIAQLQLTAFKNWSADYGLQWGEVFDGRCNTGPAAMAVAPPCYSHHHGPVRQYANLQYKPTPTSVVNLSYRYELGSVDQVEVSSAWPLTRKWNIFLREIYSLRSETYAYRPTPASEPINAAIPPKPLETFVGIEYRSCCWGVRIGGRQFVSTFNSDVRGSRESTGVFLELELMGFASVGSASDSVLMENIRGYAPPNARVPQGFVPPAFP